MAKKDMDIEDESLDLFDCFDFDDVDSEMDEEEIKEILSIIEEKNLGDELIKAVLSDDVGSFTNILLSALNDSDSLFLDYSENYRLYDDAPVSYDLDIFRVLSAVNEEFNEDYIEDFIELESGMSWEFFKQFLIDSDYMVEKSSKSWNDLSSRFTVEDLREVLSYFDLKTSGKKDELIKRLDDNGIYCPVFFELTDNGKDYLKGFAWIEFYENFLNAFDFSDFYHYKENHKDMELVDLSMAYLNEHKQRAVESDDEDYVFACDLAIDYVDEEAESLLKDLDL